MRLTSLSAVSSAGASSSVDPRTAAVPGSWRALRPKGGEAELRLPDLQAATFMGVNGPTLLMIGLVVSRARAGLRTADVHAPAESAGARVDARNLRADLRNLQDVSAHAGQVSADPGDFHRRDYRVSTSASCSGLAAFQVAIILAFSLVGIAGSYGVAWFGIRVNTFANSRTAFASLRGKPFPCYAIPLKAGMSIGMMLISVELFIMLCILLFIPGDYAGPCFIGFAIGESLGAAALRVAGGIFTKIADIGADLMKIVFKIKEDDARNPGVIADCTGDNAGDSVGPSADGFETYGVTGVALITFILLAVNNDITKVELLVWIFAMRVMMIIASALSYFINEAVAKAKYQNVDKMNYEAPLTSLVWLTSIISIGATYALSYLMIPDLGSDPTMWWKLSTIITCGTLAGRDYSGTGEGIHVGGIAPREGSGDVVARRRRVAEHSVRLGGRQLQRVLAGHDHDGADGHRLRRQHAWAWQR